MAAFFSIVDGKCFYRTFLFSPPPFLFFVKEVNELIILYMVSCFSGALVPVQVLSPHYLWTRCWGNATGGN